jgi:hypothetical protein
MDGKAHNTLGTVRVDASRVIHDVIQSVIQMIESSC